LLIFYKKLKNKNSKMLEACTPYIGHAGFLAGKFVNNFLLFKFQRATLDM